MRALFCTCARCSARARVALEHGRLAIAELGIAELGFGAPRTYQRTPWTERLQASSRGSSPTSVRCIFPHARCAMPGTGGVVAPYQRAMPCPIPTWRTAVRTCYVMPCPVLTNAGGSRVSWY
eukprot:1961961-Rhodomonas_salina.3